MVAGELFKIIDMLRCVNISFISINLESSSVGRRPSALYKKNTPTTSVFYFKDKWLGKTNIFTINQIVLRIWFLTLVLHCHLRLHPHLLQKLQYQQFEVFIKYWISVWNQVFWYEYDLSIICNSFHRSKAQKDFGKPGFCSKWDVSPLIIFRVI